MLKSLYLILSFILLFLAKIATSQCMMIPISLTERVNNSNLIIEGRVISKYAAWDAQHLKIYTHNTIDIYKTFKGFHNNNTIEIITEGGVVGNEMLVVTPSLKLSIGDAGVFTITNQNPSKLIPYASTQGFIKYDEKTNQAKAVFDTYSNFSSVYSSIENITGVNHTSIKAFNPSKGQQSQKAIPVLTTLSPTTISAGTYTLLTITGSNFGAVNGNVEFSNANDGGATFITADPSLIQSWNTTQITLFVPTQASTGVIRVTNSTSETGTSLASLTIPFNVTGLHNAFQQDKDYTPDLVNDNGAGGYSFTFNTAYFTNTNAVNRFDEVIEAWRCLGGINWNSNGAATTATNCEGLDGINLVTFDNAGCQRPPGVLGTAFSFFTACGIGGIAYWRVDELDVVFDTETTWNFTLAAPGPAEFDFFSVMLHEIGHAHQLGHVGNAPDVMFFSIAPATQKRTLIVGNSDGANFVLSRNNANEAAYNGSTGGSVFTNLCGTGPMVLNPCNSVPTTAFNANQISTCGATLNVTFTDQTLGSPTSWLWNFGDGDTSSAQNPLHNYTATGSYSVKLLTSNANGSDSLTKTNFITVGGATPTAGCAVSSIGLGAFGTGIQNFTMANINNTTDNAQADGGYQDFSCSQIISGINKGGTFNVSTTVGNTNPENVKIFIDYNDNGTFDGGEEVFASASSTGTHNGSFTISSAGTVVTNKVIRLRVVSDFNAINGGCNTVIHGQHEDYGLFINAALPIKLINFNAIAIKNNLVQLNWKTATQINNDYFTIEKSKNAIDWEFVSTTLGAGNSSSILSYTSYDNAPFLDTSYYRLKQTDFDGNFSYSTIKSVTIKNELSKLSLYPNPNNGKLLTIDYNTFFFKNAKILITDISGRTILNKQLIITKKNSTTLQFNKNLTSGFYLVTIRSENQKITKKLIVE